MFKFASIILLLGVIGGTSYYYFTHNQNGNLNEFDEIKIDVDNPNAITINNSDDGFVVSAPIATEQNQDLNTSTTTTTNTQSSDQKDLPSTSNNAKTTTIIAKEINVIGGIDENDLKPINPKEQEKATVAPPPEPKEVKVEEKPVNNEPLTPTPAQIVKEFKSKFNLPIKLSNKETLSNFQYTTGDGFTYVIKTTDHSLDTNAKKYYARYACQNEQVKHLFAYSKTVSFAFVNNKTGKTISRVNITKPICNQIAKENASAKATKKVTSTKKTNTTNKKANTTTKKTTTKKK